MRGIPRLRAGGETPRPQASVTEVTKEIHDVERRLKNINDELNSIKMFQKHNNTNFTTAMRPILKSLFYMKYEGKDGAQNLQRDLRYIKIATNSQIPEDQSLDHISNLISKGKSRVSSTVDPFVTSENVSKQNTDIKPDSTGYSSPSASASAQQPLLQNSPFQMAQYNPYFPITSPTCTSPYQYVMYPNQWNSMYDVYINGYPMYPANPMTSSTAPACAANPPLPLDSPPKNPPLPKD